MPVLRDAAQKLTGLGAGVLCAPCVTSHYFYEALSGGIPVPFVHMLRETAEELRRAGRRKTGVMATTGTVRMGLFQSALGEAGIEAQLPSPACQELVMSMIYDEIKAGKPASPEKFQAAEEELYAQGCDSIVLGCTELSLIKKSAPLGPGYLDALEVLSKRCVQLCGGALKPEYENLLT